MLFVVPRRALWLEALEDRSLPALITWIGPSGGFWNNPSNWDSTSVPGANDDVVIDLPGVQVIYTDISSIRSLSCTGKLLIQDGRLELRDPSTIDELELLGGILKARDELTLKDVIWSSGLLKTADSIVVTGEMTIFETGLKKLSGELENQGTINWRSGGTLTKPLTGIGLTLFFEWLGGRPSILVNRGSFNLSVASAFVVNNFENHGELSLISGVLQTDTFEQESGLTRFDAGTLVSKLDVRFEGGQVKGGGTIAADVVNVGATIHPGGGKELIILGDYTQRDSGTLIVTLIGPADADTYDQFLVKEKATLDGTLIVHHQGAAAKAGDHYTIVKADKLAGRFDQVQMTGAAGQSLVTYYDTDSVDIVKRSVPINPPPSDTPPSSVPVPDPAPETDPIFTNIPPTRTESPSSSSGGGGNAGDALDPSGATTSPGRLPTFREGTDTFRSLVQASVVVGGDQSLTATLITHTPGGQTEIGAASSVEKVASLTVGQSASEMASSGGQTDPAGWNDLFAIFPLALPEVEPPAEDELLASSDIARDLLIGGRARAAILPQAGVQLNPVATLIQGDDPAGTNESSSESSLGGLFLNPLSLGNSTALASLAVELSTLAVIDPPEAEDNPEERPGNRNWHRLAVLASALAGLGMWQFYSRERWRSVREVRRSGTPLCHRHPKPF